MNIKDFNNITETFQKGITSRMTGLFVKCGVPPVKNVLLWSSDNYGNLADQAQIQTEFFNQVAQWRNYHVLENQKKRALERANMGLASVCEYCGNRIPAARLHANEWATRCVICQEEYERSIR